MTEYPSRTSDNNHILAAVNTESPNGPKVRWGAAEMAPVIRRNVRQTYHLLRIGALPSVKKVAGRYCGTDDGLLRDIGAL